MVKQSISSKKKLVNALLRGWLKSSGLMRVREIVVLCKMFYDDRW